MSLPPKPGSQPDSAAPHFDEQTLVYLRALSAQYPSVDHVLTALASLRSVLTLPTGATHVISDIHGEYKKLVHVVHNASGSLRPLVDRTFGDRLAPEERLALLNLIYYPRETWQHLTLNTAPPARRDLLRHYVDLQLELLRRLAHLHSLAAVDRVFPSPYETLFRELMLAAVFDRSDAYVNALLDTFVSHDRELDFLGHLARVIRHLLVDELIVGGDFGDRGSRIDKCIGFVMQRPNVSVTWGNHDVHWMGAALGQTACIASVVRLSLRYQRLFQLEMGYGIPMAPVEKLIRLVYSDDPAERFPCLGQGIRDPLSMSRLQKAMTIIGSKLEAQTIGRNPHYQVDHRNLLHAIDPASNTITVEGKSHPLLDDHFPTVDWDQPDRLSPEEEACMAQLQLSFRQSEPLAEQMRFLERRGSMALTRDANLIFHGCVPVDDDGNFLPLTVDGTAHRGRALFDAIDTAVHRAFRLRETADTDLLWYLWAGPLSPLFGKDKMTTLERRLIADESTHIETKNPYFKLLHDQGFCRKILTEFDVDPERGLIVNGHVPVKVEEGENPVKASGQAVTIDGAFSEAYGDRGYTLVLESDRTSLALHHHFESVTDAITEGADIIPKIETLRTFDPPRTIGDVARGEEIRREIAALELLLQAYQQTILLEPSPQKR